MLGKIMKHEFKATWKYFLAIDFLTLVIGFIAGIVGYIVSDNMDDIPTTLSILLIFALAGYVFAMIAATILTTVYNVYRYYHSLYTAEGYLTFTLPANTAQILSAKMLVAIFWQLIMSLCVALSVAFLIGSFFVFGWTHGPLDFQEFFRDFLDTCRDIMGIQQVFGFIVYVFAIIMQIIMNLMMFFFAISIGQLWQKHKILGSIIAYFATRFSTGIFSLIVSIFSGSFTILFTEAYDPGRYFSHNNIVSLVLSVILVVIMYVSCLLVTDKKLNLD